MRIYKIFLLCAIVCVHAGYALALTCPEMPQQTSPKSQTEVRAAVARIGPVTGGELSTKIQTEATNLLANIQNNDRVYIQQMMYASYCSSLRDDSSKSESEKSALIAAYNSAVLGIDLPTQNSWQDLWNCIPLQVYSSDHASNTKPEKKLLDRSLYFISSHAVPNKTGCLNQLLDAGASPNVSYPTGVDDRLFNAPPLSWALWHHAWNDVRLLLKNGADPMQRAQNGETPMHWAAEVCAADDILDLLLASGDRIDTPLVSQIPPIMYVPANCRGRWESMRIEWGKKMYKQ